MFPLATVIALNTTILLNQQMMTNAAASARALAKPQIVLPEPAGRTAGVTPSAEELRRLRPRW